MVNYHDIGYRIRKKRISQNLSQEQLAEIVDISVTHMSHIETGNTKLSLPVLLKIANALESSVDELLCDSLIVSKQVYINEIADLLEKCDHSQIRFISDLVQALKKSMDKHLIQKTH